MSDFAKAIEKAQKSPELPAELEENIPDIFKGQRDDSRLFERGNSEGIPGVVSYSALDYHCARLTIGKETTGFSNGAPVLEDRDDSDELAEIMDGSLKGQVVLLNKQETFLKDGTVVIWIEWAEYKKTKKEQERLTYEQLMSPESPSMSDDDSEDTSDLDTEDED